MNNTNTNDSQQLQRIRSSLSRTSVHVSGLNLQSNRNSSFTLNNTSNHQLSSNHNNSPFVRCESKNDIAPRIPSRNW